MKTLQTTLGFCDGASTLGYGDTSDLVSRAPGLLSERFVVGTSMFCFPRAQTFKPLKLI